MIRLRRFVLRFDSMICMVNPRLARWVIVALLESEAFYVLENATFMRHRNALGWIAYESKALGAGRYEARRIK